MIGQVTLLDRAIGHLRPVITYAAVMSCFINLLILPMSLFSLQVYDRVMSTGSLSTLLWLTLIMLAIFAAVGLLQTLRSKVLGKAADWFYTEMAQTAIPLSLTHVSASKNGKNIQSLRDAGLLKQFISGAGLTTLLEAPWAVLYILVLFIIHMSLGLLVTCGAALLVILAWMNELVTAKAITQASTHQIRSMQELEIATRNADAVEAMGMTGTIVQRWKASQQAMADSQESSGNRAMMLQGITKFVRLSLQILVTALSAWLALQNLVTFGAIVAASILASRALAPFESAIASWKTFTEARAAFSRLQQTFKNPLREEGIQLPAPEGWLSVESLSYVAPGQQKPILRNVTFHLERGDLLGVVGPSGSGKSSLARLIAGTWRPSAGIVRLDDADVYTWPREAFGFYTGYLPQDVELFGGTVKENIARLDPNAPDEAVVYAAQLAGAHELILRLPKGYSTEIGAAGEFLSAGQRQRVGLARALYGEPRLLVLDEPDSNLDDAGQAALLQALQEMKRRGITVVIITHRKSMLAHADKILCMSDGAVQMFGAAKDVIAKLSPQRPNKQMENS